jgi:hypothetical protein
MKALTNIISLAPLRIPTVRTGGPNPFSSILHYIFSTDATELQQSHPLFELELIRHPQFPAPILTRAKTRTEYPKVKLKQGDSTNVFELQVNVERLMMCSLRRMSILDHGRRSNNGSALAIREATKARVSKGRIQGAMHRLRRVLALKNSSLSVFFATDLSVTPNSRLDFQRR